MRHTETETFPISPDGLGGSKGIEKKRGEHGGGCQHEPYIFGLKTSPNRYYRVSGIYYSTVSCQGQV